MVPQGGEKGALGVKKIDLADFFICYRGVNAEQRSIYIFSLRRLVREISAAIVRGGHRAETGLSSGPLLLRSADFRNFLSRIRKRLCSFCSAPRFFDSVSIFGSKRRKMSKIVIFAIKKKEEGFL